LDLQEHAYYVRSLISRLDATEGFDESALKEVIDQVEEVAARLLGLGKADPQRKAEVISWVVRFREDVGGFAHKWRRYLFPRPLAHRER
jgi:glycogen synthase